MTQIRQSARRTFIAAAVLAAASMAAPLAHAQAKVLKIGGLLTVTGPNASLGKEGLGGLEYAVKTVNASGGVTIGADTYTVQLVNIDDESKAERTAAAVEKLLADRVPLIFMTPASTTTLAVLPIMEKAKTVALNFIAAAPAVIAPEYSYSFRTTLSSITNVNPAIDYLVKEKKVKTIAFVGRNDDWGRSAGKVIIERAKGLDSQVISEDYFDPGSTDFAGLLSKIKGGNADAVVAAVSIESVAFAKQFRELRMKQTLLSVGVNMAAPAVIKAAGPAVEGAFVATGPTTTDTAKVRAFSHQFEKAQGRPPLPYEMVGSDNMMLALEAMKKAGSTDPTKIRDALRKLDYSGLLQDYSFGGQNQSEVMINVNEIKDGRAVPIGSLRTR